MLKKKVLVNIILAGIDIRSEKPTPRECMDSDMAFSNNHKPAPTAWVFDLIFRCRNDNRLYEWTHMERIAQLYKCRRNGFFAIEKLRVAPVAVYSDMFAEMG